MRFSDRQQQAPTPVRLPDDLKAALKEQATANDRSLNGEIISRLRHSFKGRRMVKPGSASPSTPAADHQEGGAPFS